MDIPTKIKDAFNAQINMELSSGYIYLSMAAFFETQGLKGFSHWMQKQADEERAHAMRFFKHINERNGAVTLQAIPVPKLTWKSPAEAFTDALAHEKKVSASIYSLVEAASKERDFAAVNFLQWFLNEQIEEEANANEWLQKLKAAGTGAGLLFLDSEAGKRS
ncbi:MAG: ferritin [Nanoarchaeota archaeon]